MPVPQPLRDWHHADRLSVRDCRQVVVFAFVPVQQSEAFGQRLMAEGRTCVASGPTPTWVRQLFGQYVAPSFEIANVSLPHSVGIAEHLSQLCFIESGLPQLALEQAALKVTNLEPVTKAPTAWVVARNDEQLSHRRAHHLAANRHAFLCVTKLDKGMDRSAQLDDVSA